VLPVLLEPHLVHQQVLMIVSLDIINQELLVLNVQLEFQPVLLPTLLLHVILDISEFQLLVIHVFPVELELTNVLQVLLHHHVSLDII
jgi:hypothetical protein